MYPLIPADSIPIGGTPVPNTALNPRSPFVKLHFPEKASVRPGQVMEIPKEKGKSGIMDAPRWICGVITCQPSCLRDVTRRFDAHTQGQKIFVIPVVASKCLN